MTEADKRMLANIKKLLGKQLPSSSSSSSSSRTSPRTSPSSSSSSSSKSSPRTSKKSKPIMDDLPIKSLSGSAKSEFSFGGSKKSRRKKKTKRRRKIKHAKLRNVNYHLDFLTFIFGPADFLLDEFGSYASSSSSLLIPLLISQNSLEPNLNGG